MYLVKEFEFLKGNCILDMSMLPEAKEMLFCPYQGRVIETIVFALKEPGTENVAIVTQF